MSRNRYAWSALLAAALLTVGIGSLRADDVVLNTNEQLGRSIFFDTNLSINQNQACAACHAPEVGFTGPVSAFNAHGAVYEGSIPGRFGNRKPPAASYATLSPILYYSEKAETWIGGNFWDGRATGEKLGNPAADQAQGPFLNPAEQGLPDAACVVWRVCEPVAPADYPVSLEDVWGMGACDIDWPMDVGTTCASEGTTVALSPADRDKVLQDYDFIGLSIAAYEGSPEVNAFSSKFDLARKGKAHLTQQERRGFALWQGKGGCHKCHISNGQRPLFTDYTYDNLGVPKNLENPVYVHDPGFVDYGLGGYLMSAGYDEDTYLEELGKVKVPTVRNVGEGSSFTIKAYGHNGYFKSLKEIVHFYNTRDVLPTCMGPGDPGEKITCWPPAEVPVNVNTEELGDLGLTDSEEWDLVAFMEALSDGFVPMHASRQPSKTVVRPVVMH